MKVIFADFRVQKPSFVLSMTVVDLLFSEGMYFLLYTILSLGDRREGCMVETIYLSRSDRWLK